MEIIFRAEGFSSLTATLTIILAFDSNSLENLKGVIATLKKQSLLHLVIFRKIRTLTVDLRVYVTSYMKRPMNSFQPVRLSN